MLIHVNCQEPYHLTKAVPVSNVDVCLIGMDKRVELKLLACLERGISPSSADIACGAEAVTASMAEGCSGSWSVWPLAGLLLWTSSGFYHHLLHLRSVKQVVHVEPFYR